MHNEKPTPIMSADEMTMLQFGEYDSAFHFCKEHILCQKFDCIITNIDTGSSAIVSPLN